MKFYFKKLVLFVVFNCFFVVHAGSYEDFFSAIKRDNGGRITELLQLGFDPNTPSPDGQQGLYLALMEGNLKAAEALIAWPRVKLEARNAADESPLMMAALKGHTELARKLVARGADVNKPGWTPLHYAATTGQVEIMAMLLERHAYIDAESPNGTTPLMMAAMYGTPEAVKLLIEAGADPQPKNMLGMTALDFAFKGNRPDSAQLIRSAQAGRQPRGKW